MSKKYTINKFAKKHTVNYESYYNETLVTKDCIKESVCIVYGRSNNTSTKQSKILLEFISLIIGKLNYNCLSVMINKVYTESCYISTDVYNCSLVEKYGILEMKTLKSGSVHKKMLITPTSAKPAQRPNTLYCVKAYLLLLC